ncbi:MAG: GMP synthase, partial [Bauldia sp.]
AIGEGSPAFHWHLDTFTLPPGAVHLAVSAMTDIQAFRIGRAVYGVQFHFEADRALVERWSGEFGDVIAEYAPDWPARRARDAVRYGPEADRVGLALARAWVGLVG